MDAREFLLAVVPWTEGYATIHWHRPGDNFLGRSCQTIEDALLAVRHLHDNTKSNIYFCLSRQRLNSGKRDKSNATGLNCLFADLDFELDNPRKYSKATEALEALFAFCVYAGIPRPSIVVYSGGGLHVYWISDHTLPVEEWLIYAEAFKRAAKNFGLKFDAGVTADAARVLRVPGTRNFKYDPPPVVRVLDKYTPGTRYDFAIAFAKLLTLAPVGPLGPVPEAFRHLGTESLGDGIKTGDVPPLPFDPIKSECGWLREAYETGGRTFDQPQWNLTTLIATWLEDGNDYAHRFGDKHPKYSFESTEKIWQRKSRERRDKDIGFPKCRTISDSGSKHCDTCPHLALGKSPLHFGLRAAEAPKPEEQPEELRLPEGFVLNKEGRICAIVPAKKLSDKNGKVSWLPQRTVQLTSSIIKAPNLQYQQGHFGLGFVASTDKGGWHDVFIPSSHVYRPHLLTRLSAACVLHTPDKEGPVYMEKLMYSWLDKLKNEQKALRDSGMLGWRYGDKGLSGFIYGGYLHGTDGSATPVTNTADDEFRRWYIPKGEKDPWLKAAKLLTDRKRPELDILISVAFAAPLMIFAGAVYGCILSCYGEPGTSKSSAQQVAAAVWGHPKQTRESLNSTAKSVQGRLGRTRNLAAYWDDIQDEKHQESLFQTLFVATTGTEGGRLNPDSTMKERLEWQTLLVACSNASFVEFLIHKQKSTTAGMRRVLEFVFDKKHDEPGMIDGLDANRAFAALEHNYGIVGEEYARMIAKEHKAIDQQLADITRSFSASVTGTPDESFWWNMCGVLIMGATLANRLGAELDVPAMTKFLTETFLHNRKTRSNEGTEGGSFGNTEQSLSKFLNFHAGSGHVIYTDRAFKHRNDPVEILREPGQNRPVYVHVIRDDRRILISKRQLRDWLQANGIQGRQVVDGLSKFFKVQEVKVTLGAGTVFAVTQEVCFALEVPAGMRLLDDLLNAQGPPKTD